MFFAEEFPTSAIVPSNAVTIVIVLQVILILTAVIGGIMAIVLAARRQPPLDKEFATKAELHREIGEVRAAIKLSDERNVTLSNQIFGELKSINSSVNRELSELNRSLGKLEGHQELANKIVETLEDRK